MGLASSFAAFVTRRQESPWEVVDSKSVEPVSIWDDEEDLEIIYIHDTPVTRTYVFDIKKEKDFENALSFAQQQLLQEVRTKGYNVLWHESWRVTLFRKGKKHRVEVRYSGRPACLSSDKPLLSPSPPFLGVLNEMRQSSCSAYAAA